MQKNFVIHLCGYNSLAAPWGREYANRSAVRLRQSLLFLGRVEKEDQIVVIEDLRTAAGNNQLNFVARLAIYLSSYLRSDTERSSSNWSRLL